MGCWSFQLKSTRKGKVWKKTEVRLQWSTASFSSRIESAEFISYFNFGWKRLVLREMYTQREFVQGTCSKQELLWE